MLLGEKLWQLQKKISFTPIGVLELGETRSVRPPPHNFKALQGNLRSLYFVPIRRNVVEKSKTETVAAQVSLNLS